MRRRSGAKEKYWRDVLRRQRTSGLTVHEFCLEEEVSTASLYRWKKVLAGSDRQAGKTTGKARHKPPGAPPLGSVPDAADPLFIPVQLNAAASSMIEVVHPLGHVVRVPAVFDQGCLRQVLEVLDQRRA